uniref:Uncharacterized protein n=1 Tax=Sphaerodactylus townsendi TaxID=933632 RepID=A0ACB8EBT7_9SAUR
MFRGNIFVSEALALCSSAPCQKVQEFRSWCVLCPLSPSAQHLREGRALGSCDLFCRKNKSWFLMPFLWRLKVAFPCKVGGADRVLRGEAKRVRKSYESVGERSDLPPTCRTNISLLDVKLYGTAASLLNLLRTSVFKERP